MEKFLIKLLKIINPLNLKDKAISPRLVLIARLLSLTLLYLGEKPFALFIPFFDFFLHFGSHLGSQEEYSKILFYLLRIGLITILFSNLTRSGAFLVFLSLGIGILSCQPCLSVAHSFVTALFLMIALSSKKSGLLLLQLQLAVVFLGAFLSKALDLDWWNGNYFDAFMIERHQNQTYQYLASFLPAKFLSMSLGIVTIFIQGIVTICFLFKKYHLLGLTLAIFFQVSLVIMTQQMFGPFFIAMMISLLAFLPTKTT